MYLIHHDLIMLYDDSVSYDDLISVDHKKTWVCMMVLCVRCFLIRGLW